MARPFPRVILSAALMACLASDASAQDPPQGLDAWWRPAPGSARPSAPPQPVELSLSWPRKPAQGLAQSAALEDWEGVIQQLLDRLAQRALRDVLVPPDRPRGVLWGAHEEARRRLRALPAEMLERHYPALAQLEAREQLQQTHRSGRAGLRRLVTLYPYSEAAHEALQRLSGSLAEDGALDAALAALRRSERPDLTQRSLLLRALPHGGSTRTGELALPPARPRPLHLRWLRRATVQAPQHVAVGRRAVYASDREGVWAASREDGRLRWRVAAGRPLASPRLALSADEGQLLVQTPATLVSLSTGDGRELWRRALTSLIETPSERDGFQALAADEQGWLALVTLEEVRRVVALDLQGETRWTSRLWSAPPPGAGGWSWSPSYRPREPAASDTPESPGSHVSAAPQRAPVATHDGQLVTLGGDAYVTCDGMLAALETWRGSIRWLRQRSLGRAGGGARTPVQLEVGPYALTASLPGGWAVRIDPWDGALLEGPPKAARRDPERGEPESYLLSWVPPQVAWRFPDQPQLLDLGARTVGVAQVAGPGAWWGDALVLPGRRGLTVLPRGSDARELSWPAETWATWVWRCGDVLLAGGEGNLLVYSAEPDRAPPAELPDDPAGLAAALGHPSWRLRHRARRELAALLERDPRALAGVTLEDAEAADTLARLGREVERRARWRRLLPAEQGELALRLAQHPDAGTLQRALGLLPAREGIEPARAAAVARDLRAELRELRDRFALAWPLARELLLREPLEQGRVVLELRQASEVAEALAAGELLVALAAAGGSLDPLRRCLEHPDETTRAVVVLLLANQPQLRERVDARDWDQAGPEALQTLAMRWGGFTPPDWRARQAVRERLLQGLAED